MLFGSGMSEIGAHCTLPGRADFPERPARRPRTAEDRAVTTPREAEERQKTLRTLLELAGGFSPSDWGDDQRAMALLRSQSTVEELRQLGASDGIIAHIFGEDGRG